MNSMQLKKLVTLIAALLLLFTACTQATSEPVESNDANDIVETPTSPRISSTGSVPLKLYVLDCGRIVTRDLSIMFSPGAENVGREMELADACYLIEHPTEGTLLWDTGLSDGLANMENGMDLDDLALNFSVPKTVESQLSEIGVDPLEITYLAFSHLHGDHTGNANYFTNSTLLMQEVDYSVAFSEDAVNYGYNPGDYSALKDSPVVE